MASHSAMRIFTAGSTANPAISAILAADWPTMAALRWPSTKRVAARAARCSSVTNRQPRNTNSALTASATDSSTITACSEAQIMPLSKVLLMITELTDILMLAVASMTTGVLPAPTPMAGLPEL